MADIRRWAVALPEGEPPREFIVFAPGTTDTSQGAYVFDDVAAALVMQAFARQGNDLLIDYEHKSLDPTAPPGAGKAAGWFRPEVRDGACWAVNVQWTEPAQQELTRREWRFFSPAALVDPETGRVEELLNLALTNMPATRNMTPLVASRRSPEEIPMSLKPFALALGLPESATEKEILDGIRSLSADRDAVVEGRTAVLSATGTDSVERALGVIAGWRAGADRVTELASRVSELEAEGERRDKETLLAAHPRKFSPALKEWAKTQSLTALKGFVASAPDIQAFSRETPEPEKPAYSGKPWAQMTPGEKHELFFKDRALYDALKAAGR